MNLFSQLHPDWQIALAPMRSNFEAIDAQLIEQDITPAYEFVLRSLNTPIDSIRVVIVGQDPYPNPAHANGLAFSVAPSVSPLPATLRNIFKELVNDCAIIHPENGDLTHWAEQGVLLLNRVLTTQVNQSLTHSDIGWQVITDEVARILGTRDVIAVLWGKSAQELLPYFSNELVISGVHPSPLSAYRGFFGSKPFSRVNEILSGQGRSLIEW
ncbi:MAG: uracil-DNA glycosylase [Candidatus Planktophila sp.]|nr:uracil-DNA glycosylase [Candidatus Planktophila sp.]